MKSKESINNKISKLYNYEKQLLVKNMKGYLTTTAIYTTIIVTLASYKMYDDNKIDTEKINETFKQEVINIINFDNLSEEINIVNFSDENTVAVHGKWNEFTNPNSETGIFKATREVNVYDLDAENVNIKKEYNNVNTIDELVSLIGEPIATFDESRYFDKETFEQYEYNADKSIMNLYGLYYTTEEEIYIAEEKKSFNEYLDEELYEKIMASNGILFQILLSASLLRRENKKEDIKNQILCEIEEVFEHINNLIKNNLSKRSVILELNKYGYISNKDVDKLGISTTEEELLNNLIYNLEELSQDLNENNEKKYIR